MATKSKRTKTPPMAALGGEGEKEGPDDEAKDWGERLLRAKQFQEKYSAGWDENKRLIFCETNQGGGKETFGRANQVAYGWGLYEGLETTIYVQNPTVLVSAREAGDRPAAQRVAQIVKYDLDIMNTKDLGNLCLLDTFVCGYGALIEGVETYHKYDAEGKKTGEVSGQEFQFRRIDPKDILFDPASRMLDLSDCKYLFVAWYPTIEQLRKDPNINALPEDIESYPECTEGSRVMGPTSVGGAPRQGSMTQSGYGAAEEDPAYKTICVWEVYDKVNHKILYQTDYKGITIGKAGWPVNLQFGCRDLFPITLLYQHPIPGRFYPRPEAELIAPQLREINIVERLISEQTVTKRRKHVTWSGLLSEDQKAKVNDTSVANDILFLDGTKLQDALGLTSPPDSQAYNINNVVASIDEIKPPPDLGPRYAMLEQEIFHVVGYGPSQRGGLPSTRSAREAMMINAEKERKLDKRRDRVTDFYRYLSMKHVRFLKKYMSVERYAKVLPKSIGLVDWQKYGREDISGDFEFDVVAGTSVPKNTEVKQSSEMQLFQAIAPIIMQSGGDIRPAFYRLAEFNDWDNVDDLFGGLKQKGMQAVEAISGFNAGKVPPELLLNVFSQLVMAVLSPAEFQMAKKQIEGQMAKAPQPGGNAPVGQRGDPNPNATSMGVP